jgi:hypothetical protein
MAIRPLLRRLRAGFLAIVALSLFAAGVRWSDNHPDGAVQTLFIALASAPKIVADAWVNLTAGPFVNVHVPDRFGARHRYRPVVNRTAHRIEGLVMRLGDSAAPPQRGWRLLQGIMQIDGEPRYAVLALSPDFEVRHAWLINRAALASGEISVGQAPAPHGLALLGDGSMLAGWDNLHFPVRVERCGRIRWTSAAGLNHAIHAVEARGHAWGPGFDNRAEQIDLRDGRLLRSISMDDLRAANPDVSALEMRRIDEEMAGDNPRGDVARYYYDAYHINDVEPLPAPIAARFPGFRAGDLLISARSLNLVMVVDPDRLKIRWLTNDHMLRQHDPDWNANGEISVLDNQNGRQYSRILAFDPATGAHRVVLDGRTVDFYTRIRGKHQLLGGGGVLVASAGQGRVFETGADGRIAFELLVQDPARPGSNFVVTDARFFPPDHPPLKDIAPCPAQ